MGGQKLALQIHVVPVDKATVIHLKGRIDGPAAEYLLTTLSSLIETDKILLVVDFKDLKFIGSVGLRALLACDRKLKPKTGQLHLCNLSRDIAEVFEITAFTELFPIHADLDQALAKINGDSSTAPGVSAM